MSKQKKMLMWTVYVVALIQMIGVALSPAVDQMTRVFSGYSLSVIQTVISLPGLLIPTVGLVAAELIRRSVVTKKAVVTAGLFSMGAAGLLSLVLHDRFWHVVVLCGLMGISAGCYLSTILSIMVDRFSPDERKTVTGYQAVFVNIGGFLCGVFGGMLAGWKWYGGFLVALVGIPMGVMSIFMLPKEDRVHGAGKKSAGQRTRLNPDIFYHAIVLTVFMMLFVVCNGNLAVHLTNSGYTDTTLIGLVASVQMAGGAAFGFFFAKVSGRLKDRLPEIAFFMLFLSYTALNVFHGSLVMQIFSVFFLGMALSVISPYCVIAVSGCVDASTSAFATSLITGFAPGIGGFLSPLILTNLTNRLGGSSTSYRYQFVGFLALGCGALMAAATMLRRKRKAAQSAASKGSSKESI